MFDVWDVKRYVCNDARPTIGQVYKLKSFEKRAKAARVENHEHYLVISNIKNSNLENSEFSAKLRLYYRLCTGNFFLYKKTHQISLR